MWPREATRWQTDHFMQFPFCNASTEDPDATWEVTWHAIFRTFILNSECVSSCLHYLYVLKTHQSQLPKSNSSNYPKHSSWATLLSSGVPFFPAAEVKTDRGASPSPCTLILPVGTWPVDHISVSVRQGACLTQLAFANLNYQICIGTSVEACSVAWASSIAGATDVKRGAVTGNTVQAGVNLFSWKLLKSPSDIVFN